jgi:hypothetical protein
LVFDDYHAPGRQINHLAALTLQTLHVPQVSLTVLAELHRVDNHLSGRGREHQGVPGMIGLPAGLLAIWLAQTPGVPMKAVRGWRQMAVVAIFLQALLLVDHSLLQTCSFSQRLILFSRGDQEMRSVLLLVSWPYCTLSWLARQVL